MKEFGFRLHMYVTLHVVLRVLLDFGILGFRISKGTWNRRKYRLCGRGGKLSLIYRLTSPCRDWYFKDCRFEMSDEPGEEKSSKSITRVQLLLSFFFSTWKSRVIHSSLFSRRDDKSMHLIRLENVRTSLVTVPSPSIRASSLMTTFQGKWDRLENCRIW